MELTGKLILKEDTNQITGSFKKREFVIEIENERNSEWNDFVKCQLTQDRCSLIDPIGIGDTITVFVNIRGRKWEKDGKVSYFNTIEAWKIDAIAKAQSDLERTMNEPLDASNFDLGSPDETDDLPF